MAERVVATYSIAACDLAAGQWGVAVQSKFLAVGSVVPWAEPGAGAVATQSYANPRYGPEGLALLRQGRTAQETVDVLTAADDGRAQRQVGIVDAKGGAATFTGAECHEWAGGRTGVGYAAQGNILVSAATVDALAETFATTSGRSRSCGGCTRPTSCSSARRPVTGGSRLTRTCARRSPGCSPLSATSRSTTGRESRTSRSASTATRRSTRSCCES